MYGLSAEDQRIRDTAHEFAESLVPYEVEAELAGGKLPKELTAEFQARAIELGLYATNMPKSVGGQGYTALQQVLVQAGLTASGKEAKRLIAEGGLRLDNEPVTDPQATLGADQLDAGIKVSIGRKKHRMLRLG